MMPILFGKRNAKKKKNIEEKSDQVVKTYHIFWDGLSLDTMLYGSRIHYMPEHQVYYQNDILPSGTILKTWYSSVNYQVKRHEAQLPLLEEGRRYRIRGIMESNPENTLLLRVNFLSRAGKNMENFFIEGEKEFICPNKAYSYTIELINGGMQSFLFHEIEISKLMTDESEIGKH